MDEDGTAAPFDRWAAVPIAIDHQVIEPILAPHLLMACLEGQGHRLIVAWRAHIVAPSILATNRRHRQTVRAEAVAIQTGKGLQEPPAPSRGRAITFAFVVRDAGAAKAHLQSQRAGHEPASLPVARISKDVDAGEAVVHEVC